MIRDHAQVNGTLGCFCTGLKVCPQCKSGQNLSGYQEDRTTIMTLAALCQLRSLSLIASRQGADCYLDTDEDCPWHAHQPMQPVLISPAWDRVMRHACCNVIFVLIAAPSTLLWNLDRLKRSTHDGIATLDIMPWACRVWKARRMHHSCLRAIDAPSAAQTQALTEPAFVEPR